MGGDRWGCASGPPPVVVVVVVVVAQGFKGDVLLKDWSVRHATSLSPIQTLPAQKGRTKKLDAYIGHVRSNGVNGYSRKHK